MKWLGMAIIGIAAWLLLRSGSSSGSEVSSIIASCEPTQLGMPQQFISALTYAQIQNDVQAFIDPSTGQIIPNKPGLVTGAVPVVALTNPAQIAQWAQLNPKAVQDANSNQLGSTAAQIQNILQSF